MEQLKNWLLEEESGQGMVEYGLIIVLIALVVAGALATLGESLESKFGEINDELGTSST